MPCMASFGLVQRSILVSLVLGCGVATQCPFIAFLGTHFLRSMYYLLGSGCFLGVWHLGCVFSKGGGSFLCVLSKEGLPKDAIRGIHIYLLQFFSKVYMLYMLFGCIFCAFGDVGVFKDIFAVAFLPLGV